MPVMGFSVRPRNNFTFNFAKMSALNELVNFKPPHSTKQKIYDWHKKLIELNKNMDSLNQKYLKDLHKEYEKVRLEFVLL